MKRYILIILIFCSVACAVADEKKDARHVQLTENEKELCKEVLDCPPCHHRITTMPTILLLKRGCGFELRTHPVSYDANVHPDCPEVLKFLAYFVAQQGRIDNEAEDLLYDLAYDMD